MSRIMTIPDSRFFLKMTKFTDASFSVYKHLQSKHISEKNYAYICTTLKHKEINNGYQFKSTKRTNQT